MKGVDILLSIRAQLQFMKPAESVAEQMKRDLWQHELDQRIHRLHFEIEEILKNDGFNPERFTVPVQKVP